MVSIGASELLILIVIFFSGGFGLPLGIPPAPEDELLARVAPEQCLFYTTWAGTAKADPQSPNQTEQLIAEAEIQQLIATLDQQLGAALSQVAEC